MDTTDDYCQQLVAEQRLVISTGRVVWIKTAKDNHHLDAEALNVAAAQALAVHTLQPQVEEKRSRTQCDGGGLPGCKATQSAERGLD